MSIGLPVNPAPVSATPSYLDWGGILRPIFGGALQKLNRLGDRYALAVEMPPLESADQGLLWVGRLINARRQGAVMRWPLGGFVPGNTGDVRVLAGGQSGSSLSLHQFSPGYVVREGQPFSVIHGGRRYMHMAQTTIQADGQDRIVLPIAPMLRVSPAAQSICEFAEPKIEGFLDGDAQTWTLDVALNVGLSFTIMEAK